MTDIIKILPDNVANQIAAGEVIQRPASAVKELLENAVDSGASEIQLIVKDAGKTLILVVDNGCGMSATDARICLERHATSKITAAKDLFAIHTFGFRGEALASVAAIAQLELKTKRVEDELGTLIEAEGSQVKNQSVCSCNSGTSISVKNLFFNVPARRNFLKSDATETSYIMEEFQRVALVNPDVSFIMHHNGKLVFHLDKAGLKTRITGIFGNNYNERLIPIDEQTSVVKVSGYIGKPEFARKTRTEQYFFVNGRYVRHPYFHHSVESSFEELIRQNLHPSYFIYLKVDPKQIDVNIHPTKTEIKFLDDKVIYSIIRAAVRKAIGKFSLAPSLDFDTERGLEINLDDDHKGIKVPGITVNPYFNPFDKHEKGNQVNKDDKRESDNRKNWKILFNQEPPETSVEKEITDYEDTLQQTELPLPTDNQDQATTFIQLNGGFLICSIKSGLMVIDRQAALERILFEKNIQMLTNQRTPIQQQMFPQSHTFNPAEAELLAELKDELRTTGFDIEPLGNNTFVINGAPPGTFETEIKEIIEGVLELYRSNLLGQITDKKTNLARSIARKMANKAVGKMHQTEIQVLVNALFSCEMPDFSPSGKKILLILPAEEIEKKFK